MIDTEQTPCKHCGRPLVQSGGRGHRQRQHCNDACRQLGYRHRKEQEARATIRERWERYLPTMQQLLEDIMQLHGAALLTDEQDRIQPRFTETQDREACSRQDISVRPFKAWLRKYPQPHESDFARQFLAGSRQPHHGSRSLYAAQLRHYGYSAEDHYLFEEAWKEMLFAQKEPS